MTRPRGGPAGRSEGPPQGSTARIAAPAPAGAADARGVPCHGLLELRGVYRSFGGVVAADDVSLVVREGEITGLIGPNGAGKSTVINIIGGDMAPERGRVILSGRDITRLPPHRRCRLGVVRTFQLSSEFGRLTVLDNVIVAAQRQRGESLAWVLARGRGGWRDQERALVARAWELLDRLELADHASDYAATLSGGQKRILELARAIMADPVLLVLDEPMAGVNPVTALELADHVQRLNAKGLTVLLTEHDMGMVERLCDRVLVMSRGSIVADGPLAEIQNAKAVRDAYLLG